MYFLLKGICLIIIIIIFLLETVLQWLLISQRKSIKSLRVYFFLILKLYLFLSVYPIKEWFSVLTFSSHRMNYSLLKNPCMSLCSIQKSIFSIFSFYGFFSVIELYKSIISAWSFTQFFSSTSCSQFLLPRFLQEALNQVISLNSYSISKRNYNVQNFHR